MPTPGQMGQTGWPKYCDIATFLWRLSATLCGLLLLVHTLNRAIIAGAGAR